MPNISRCVLWNCIVPWVVQAFIIEQKLTNHPFRSALPERRSVPHPVFFGGGGRMAGGGVWRRKGTRVPHTTRKLYTITAAITRGGTANAHDALARLQKPEIAALYNAGLARPMARRATTQRNARRRSQALARGVYTLLCTIIWYMYIYIHIQYTV